MIESSPEQTKTFPDASSNLERRRRKRHHAHRQKRLERLRKKALIVFLFALTIGVTLAIWYELLKS